jgi:putative hemolysin
MPDIITTAFVKQILPFNDFWSKVVMRVLRLNKINSMYNSLYPSKDIELIEKLFKYLNINLVFDENQLENIPHQGPFITISNHPFGFIDGFYLIWLVANKRKRQDLRITANYLLQPISAPLEKYFISVNPFDSNKKMGGSKKSLEHLEKGNALALFPAGEVSTYYKGQTGIMDRPWGQSSMRLISKAMVPLIPIFFHGRNSSFFHFMGKIHPFLRTALLPSEFLRKRNFTMQATIGKAILFDEYKDIEDVGELGTYLRSRVYDLKNQS